MKLLYSHIGKQRGKSLASKEPKPKSVIIIVIY